MPGLAGHSLPSPCRWPWSTKPASPAQLLLGHGRQPWIWWQWPPVLASSQCIAWTGSSCGQQAWRPLPQPSAGAQMVLTHAAPSFQIAIISVRAPSHSHFIPCAGKVLAVGSAVGRVILFAVETATLLPSPLLHSGAGAGAGQRPAPAQTKSAIMHMSWVQGVHGPPMSELSQVR